MLLNSIIIQFYPTIINYARIKLILINKNIHSLYFNDSVIVIYYLKMI